MDPRVRAWMDRQRGKIVWFRLALDSRRHPEVRSTAALASHEDGVVPGAGLFVALGTSTCFCGEANVHRNVRVLDSLLLPSELNHVYDVVTSSQPSIDGY